MSLPEGIEPDTEIEVLWHRDESGGAKVVATLGDTSFTVVTHDEERHLVPWLVASAPTILEAAWAAVEQEQDNQEEAHRG